MNDIVAPSAGQIGRSLQRIEARAKVTGRAEYIHNLRLPGMLHAKTCCSRSWRSARCAMSAFLKKKASRRNYWLPTSDSPLEGYGFEPSVPRRLRTADSASLV